MALALAGCRERRPSPADELVTLLTSGRDSTPTAADSVFDRCLYVYDSAEKVRECLVVTHKWEPAAAERRLAQRRREVQRLLDSVQAEEAKAQRERARQAAAAQAKVEAEYRRQSAAWAKAEADRERQRQFDREHSRPYRAAIGGTLYYKNTPQCAPSTAIPVSQRRHFDNNAEAEYAGLTRSGEDGC